jgi:hypothetical protein
MFLHFACTIFLVIPSVFLNPMFIFGHCVVENAYVTNVKCNEFPRDPIGWISFNLKNPKPAGVKQVYPM